MKHPSVRICSAVALAAGLTFGGGAVAQAAPAPLLAPATLAADDSGFYATPATLPANNGDVVRAEPSAFYLDPLKTIRAQASVQRIMYRSVNSSGVPIAATGTVLVPFAAWTGSGPRPLVSYAVGTQGQGDQCAPSRAMAAGGEYEGTFIAGLLARGYSVAVTDYEGLGTAGSHTYMARESQGHAVLDAARAAQRLGDPQIVAGGPVALAGYSQGGGGSAAAVELATQYAPDLNLKGAYAGAVPADLPAVGKNLDGGLYTGFLLYAWTGMGATAGVDLSPYLNDAGRTKLAATDTECTAQSIASSGFQDTSKLTVSGQKMSALLALPEFKSILDEQKIGNGRAPAVPTLLSHSLLDDVIPFDVGRQLAKRWCAGGSNVYFDVTAGATHVGGYIAAMPDAFAFLEGRFSGRPAFNNCWLYG